MEKEWKEWLADFIWGGSRRIADGDYCLKIKRVLLLGKKVMANLDSILKSRDITWATKVHLVKAMVFPVVMHGCESWTIKKVECQRADAFELWCWRRLLRVPWTARRSNQSIRKEISPEYSLEGLMLKLKLILWPPDVKTWLIWKDPDAGKDWRWEEKGTAEDETVDGITDSVGMSLSILREMVMDRVAWRAAVHGVAKNQTRLSDWTKLKIQVKGPICSQNPGRYSPKYGYLSLSTKVPSFGQAYRGPPWWLRR